MTKTQTAVLLAAGVGSRLRPLTDDRPKALVEVGGASLLVRSVRALIGRGVEHLVIATGYKDRAVREVLDAQPVRVTYCHNPDYSTTQNSVSLALCEGPLRGHSFFRLDADLLFHPDVLERIEQSAAPLAVAVDSDRELDAEAMKVRVDPWPRIVDFGKGIAVEAAAGESIGVERVDARLSDALFDALGAAIAAGETALYYEDVYARMLGEGRMQAAAVACGDLPWAEIDDLDDLRGAEQLLGEGGALGG